MAQDSAPTDQEASKTGMNAGDLPPEAALAMLQWYVDVGVETPIAANPIAWSEHRAKAEPKPAAAPAGSKAKPAADGDAPLGTAEAVVAAQRLAAEAKDLDALRKTLEEFNGLEIVKTAQNLVFSDGTPGSPLMVVGEAPGRDEDEQGKPFVGASGQLLDKILRAIGRDRTDTYISNIVNWRPPGNRKPTTGEIEVCKPFIMRHITLAAPKTVVLMGDTASKALLPVTQGITRYRGQWHDVKPGPDAPEVKALATFHPAFLLRSPARKREVWLDFLQIAASIKTP